jgi:phosphoenolpyruvate carboxylase
MSTPDYTTIGFEKMDRDLRFLMQCFAEVLGELGHAELAANLPWISSTSVEAPARLGLAYSVAFQLLNMVEENAAAEVRALRERHEGLAAERGCWGSQLARLQASGVHGEEIAAAMRKVRVEPVLTAHPTEAKRLSVLDQHRVLFGLLVQSGGENLTPSQRRTNREAVKATLERLWRTGEILIEKPTLADERRNVLHYLREIFPAVLPALDERLRQAWGDAGLDAALLAPADALPRLRFGTWVGGDRDGHPGVTADVTRETLTQLRVNALVVIRRQLAALAERLSLSTWLEPAPPRLLEIIARLEAALGADAPEPSRRDEPWRRCVELLLARLPIEDTPGSDARLRKHAGAYRVSAGLREDLDLLHTTLVEAKAARLATHDVAPVRRTVEVFGFHLAQLDIRQNSVFHAKALSQLLGAAGLSSDPWDEWSEPERLRFLERELRSPRPFLHASASAGAEAEAVLGCYRVLAAHTENFGANGIGSLIVSMTRRVSDLLAVYLLAREAGLVVSSRDGLACLLPVVPLFETIEDLEHGLGCLSMAAACRVYGSPAEISTIDISPRDQKLNWALELKGEPKVFKVSRDEVWGEHVDPELVKSVEQLTGTSVEVLARLVKEKPRFDLIFIDAGHDLFSVVHDLCYSAQLLAEGGLILMDDFAPLEDFGIGTCMVVSHARRWFDSVQIIQSEGVIFGGAQHADTPRGMVVLTGLRKAPVVDPWRMLWWRLAGFVMRVCESARVFPLRG